MLNTLSRLCLGLVLATVPVTLAQAADVVGSVSRIQGFAKMTGEGTTRQLIAGSPIYLNDIVETGDEARLEITFQDESVMTLGENARLQIDRFVFDPDTAGSLDFEQSIRILAGTFGMVTGGIGKANPDGVSVRTPVATIGIRGTDFFGGPMQSGMPEGQLHYGFQVYSGAVEIFNEHGSVLLDEPGEGTFLPLDGGKAPGPVKVWARDTVSEAIGSISFQ